MVGVKRLHLERLKKRRQELEDLWYHKGEFNPVNWERLAKSFDRRGLVSGAVSVRQKSTSIQRASA